MAREVKCANGHTYDSGIYASCPYCKTGSNYIEFGGAQSGIGSGIGTGIGNQPGYQDPFEDVHSHLGPSNQNVGVTVAKGYAMGNNAGTTQDPVGPTHPKDGAGPTKPQPVGPTTVVNRPIDTKEEPVAGWLVCIHGPEKGKDYHLYTRNNTIGRTDLSGEWLPDISVDGDISIDRKQAEIAYNYRNNAFKIKQWQGCKNIIYINGEDCDSARKLEAYDIVEFGKSKFMFVPFCCEKFKWISDDDAERSSEKFNWLSDDSGERK